MNNKLTKGMIEHFNLLLEKEGSCLRYVQSEDSNTFVLLCVDKYINKAYMNIPNITYTLEKKVRDFFVENYGVTELGFTNSVTTLFTYDEKLIQK